MSTFGKIVDATVIVGSSVVAVGAVKGISQGIKSKKNGVILLSAITLTIAIYAFKEAYRKINE